MKDPIKLTFKISVGILAVAIMMAFVFLYSAPSALADSAPAPKAAKRNNIDFEDQLVQGEVKKPELFYLLQKKQFNFGKLIKLRENFIPEMTKTSEDIEKAK